MFIYIGVVLVLIMVFKYVVFVGLVFVGLYKIVKDLWENYDRVCDEVVKIFENLDYLI